MDGQILLNIREEIENTVRKMYEEDKAKFGAREVNKMEDDKEGVVELDEKIQKELNEYYSRLKQASGIGSYLYKTDINQNLEIDYMGYYKMLDKIMALMDDEEYKKHKPSIIQSYIKLMELIVKLRELEKEKGK